MSADVQSVHQTPEEKKTRREELLEALEKLGPCSNVIDENGEMVLNCLSSIDLNPGAFVIRQDFQWMTTEKVLCLNLVRYFYKNLKKSEVSEDVDQPSEDVDQPSEDVDKPSEDVDQRSEDGELHIVLVGKGSISDQIHPADWFVPLDTITDTILYPPWNCAIDAKVAYGISTGSILPEHRVFKTRFQGPLPERWNSMAAQQTTGVPEIILGPMRNDADSITKLSDLAEWKVLLKYRNRLIIKYQPGGVFANWLPEVALYKIIGVIAFLLRIFKKKATIHLAAGLEYNGTTPLNERKLQEQYAYTKSGNVMSTRSRLSIPNLKLSTLYKFLFTEFNKLHEN
ncbi:hypothetical protein SRHO_G00049110 [Serrasalmus rhombeus]